MLPDLFYITIFTVSIVASTITIFLGLSIIITVIVHRPSRTVKNLLLCNTVVATCIFACFQIVMATFGLLSDSIHPPPACVFQGYFFSATAALVCTSYLIQSLSSFFFVALYQHHYMLGWKTHWIMIGGSYVWALLVPLLTLPLERSYEFEPKARLCWNTAKLFYSSLLGVTPTYLIPLAITSIIYGIIFYKTRQSTRRVTALGTDRSADQTNSVIPNLQREWKMMKNILLLVSIIVFAGIPYLTLIIWSGISSVSPPPEPLYLLAAENVTLFFVLKMLVLLYLNKQVKLILMQFLRKFLSTQPII